MREWKALSCLLALIVISASAAFAQTVVTVTPGAMNGWVIAAPYGANAYLSATVPSPLDNPNPADEQWPGAFFVQTNDADFMDHPGQGWIGNTTYNGTYCRDIQDMFYYTYTGWWGWEPRTNHFARQPIRIWMLTTKVGDDANRRMLVYCPWGLLDSGENQARYGVWEKQRCMADCPTTTDPAYAGQGDRAYPGWYEIVSNKYGDWDYFFNPTTGQLKNAKIVAPGALAAGWDSDPMVNGFNQMACTPTGAGLNLWVGARSDHPVGIFGMPPGIAYSWNLDSFKVSAFADNFSITIAGQETVYDFESDRDPGVYCLTSGDEILHSATKRGKPINYYKVHGRVVDVPEVFDLGQRDFWIEDASGTHIKVIAPGHGMEEGWYVDATGILEPYMTRVCPEIWLECQDFPVMSTTWERVFHQQ